MTPPRVAIVHDYLTQRGGAERVVLAMAAAFPDAPVHTMLYDPDTTFPELREIDVRPSWLNRVAFLRRHHRLALPVLAPAVSRWTVPAEVAICSSSGWAHGVRTPARKIVYCYTPARWLYRPDQYAGGRRAVSGAIQVLGPPLRRWDTTAAHRADRYLAISTFVAGEVARCYGIEAEVLAPPVTVELDGSTQPVEGVASGGALCVARLLPYKHVDAVVEAFASGPLRREQLVLVGEGPELARVRHRASPNVRVLGAVSDPELRWLYRNTAGLVAAAFEDFGLTPLEAAAFGRPTAALRAGGYLDTVVDGETGVLFATPEPAVIAAAVRRMLDSTWDADRLVAQAARFSLDRFTTRLTEVVRDVGGWRSDGTTRGHDRDR